MVSHSKASCWASDAGEGEAVPGLRCRTGVCPFPSTMSSELCALDKHGARTVQGWSENEASLKQGISDSTRTRSKLRLVPLSP